ncbi:MAG: TonB C-terminal domain-containing protein [bacterium]
MKQSLLVSLVAHILLLLAIALWPQQSLPKKTTTITINYVPVKPLPKPEVEKPQPQRVEPPPPPKVEPRNDEQIARRLEQILKNRRQTPKPTPAPTRVRPKQTPTQIAKNTTPTPTPDERFKPIQEIRPDQPVSPPPTLSPDAEASPDKQLVFEEEGFNYQGYADRLMRTLSRNWDPPAWQPTRPEGIYTQICFMIQSNGTIVRAFVERESGWQELDDSALRAVRRSSPVEPLPAGYRGSSVTAHAKFNPIPR